MDTLVRRQVFLDNFIDFPLRYGFWAISEDILFDILQFSLFREPRTILDLGTGTTTVVMSKYAKKMKEKGIDVSIISVDSNKEWLEDTSILLKKVGVNGFATLVHAEICEGDLGKYYNPEPIIKALGDKTIDLMIVDGPPGTIQNEARYPAVPYFKQFFNDDTVIFLDDGIRQQEKNIALRWSEDLETWDMEYRAYIKGGYVFYKSSSSVKRFLIPNYNTASIKI